MMIVMKTLSAFLHTLISFLISFTWLASTPSFAETIFGNARWRIEFDSIMLSTKVTPVSSATAVVSNDVDHHRLLVLTNTAKKAPCEWDDDAYRTETALSDRDLALTIQTKFAGTLNLIHQSRTNQSP